MPQIGPAEFILNQNQWPAPPQPLGVEAIAKSKEEVKKKPITEYSTVEEVFKVKKPNRLTPEKAEEFIKFNNLYMPYAYRFADPKALIGIEVEVENVLHIDPNIPLGFWEIAEDGSLRNNGREFKTVALPMRYAQHALTQLSNGLNASVDFSVRTSVHVHQDVRGMTLNQLICLLLTYTTVESLLFKFAGNNRRNSIYCVPLRETDLMDRWSSHQVMVKQLRQINANWHKYSALNLLPIATFGTVEYRHMPGTLDIKRLLIWLDLIAHLKIFAYKLDYDELTNMVCDLNTNSEYLHFVEKVFGNLTEHLDTKTLQQDMEKNVYLVKNACIANDFHSKVTSAKMHPESALGRRWAPKSMEEFFGATRFEMFKKWIAAVYPTYLHDREKMEYLFNEIRRRPNEFMRGPSGTNKMLAAAFNLKYKTYTYGLDEEI